MTRCAFFGCIHERESGQYVGDRSDLCPDHAKLHDAALVASYRGDNEPLYKFACLSSGLPYTPPKSMPVDLGRQVPLTIIPEDNWKVFHIYLSDPDNVRLNERLISLHRSNGWHIDHEEAVVGNPDCIYPGSENLIHVVTMTRL